MARKTITNISILQSGSPPDIDTDFATDSREKVINHCIDLHGKENVANVITFTQFKAKSALKAIAKVYNIPFSVTNRLTALIPPPLEGEECTLDDLLNPDSMRYDEGVDFREATKDPKWKDIFDRAIPFDKRIKETSVHPCGLIISSEPIAHNVPTQVRQDDNVIVTQWTYPELESMGLIKMDFLGLECLDFIRDTLNNIEFSNKKVPDLNEIIHGEMDDKATFHMLSEGHTIGVFQLSSEGMQTLIRSIKPTEFNDISAILALYRPGPMKSNAHKQYAARKNGAEEVIYIDPIFQDSALSEILKETYGLLIYQESCMKIATQFADMTPYESDLLRKAISKKKRKLMMELKPKFSAGVMAHGYTQKDVDLLWDTIERFGSYGFNKSHSVSYAINAYQTAYLKTHFPKEFMATSIQTNSGDNKKLPMFIQETNRMGLRIGGVNINESYEIVRPVDNNKYDILYGLSTVKYMNYDFAKIIVDERNKHGKYKDTVDFIKRVNAISTIKSQALASLAQSGAFDCFNISRKAVVENAAKLIKMATKVASKGISLFESFTGTDILMDSIDLNTEDFSFSEKVKREALTAGFYISATPIDHIKKSAFKNKIMSIGDLTKKVGNNKSVSIGAFTKIDNIVKKDGTRSISVAFYDNTGTITAYLSRELVARVEKGIQLKRISDAKAKAKKDGTEFKMSEITGKKAEQIKAIMADETIIPIMNLEEFIPYMITVKSRGSDLDGMKYNIVELEELILSKNGTMPFQVIVDNENKVDKIKEVLQKQNKGETEVQCVLPDKKIMLSEYPVNINQNLVIEIEKIVGFENIVKL